MKIVITGSEGYIGKVVTKKIRETTRHDIIEVDLKRGTNIKDYFGLKADVLIHLAAFTSVIQSVSSFRDYMENNVSHYIEFLKYNRFDRIIYASSASVYDESGDIAPASPYALTKLSGEYISQWHSDNVLTLRFANPIGIDPCIHTKENYHSMASGEPCVMVKLAMAKQLNKVFQIHNMPGMVRDFFTVNLIADVIKEQLEGVKGTWYLGSNTATEVSFLLLDLCQKYGIKYEIIDPPPGVVQTFIPHSLYSLGRKQSINWSDEFEKYLKINWI
jgi:nucleoside-diphosphate-sugar epimerase